MGFMVSEQIWQYVEKLYIHCYKIDGFIDFLKSRDIILPQDFYANRDIPIIMSTDSRDFSHYMKGVSFYRYISVLEGMIFDRKIKDTQLEEMEYYGIYVKSWYPQLIDQIQKAGLIIDNVENKVNRKEDTSSEGVSSQDLLVMSFNDIFLDYIKKEINECYSRGNYLAAMILGRKLAECTIIRIFEVVFRKKDVNGTYNAAHHALWFDTAKNRILDFDDLLQNLKDNSADFQEDKVLVEEISLQVRTFKNETNQLVHRDYKIPNQKGVDGWDLPGIFGKLCKVYKKYCNP